jgi:hypothetical protein
VADQQQGQNAPDQRVQLFVEDHTGNKRRQARVATQAAIRDLIPALIQALGLPVTDPSGRPVTYHLAFGERQLKAEETLGSAGVSEGATITLVPELIAG